MTMIMIFIALLLTSCGQMGDLYLPKQHKATTTDNVAASVETNSANQATASVETNSANQVAALTENIPEKKAATSAHNNPATKTTRYHQEQFDQDDKEQHANN